MIEAGFTGGCLCGAIRYRVTAEPVIMGACHCTACQTVAGGAPAHSLIVSKAAFTLERGEPTVYQSTANSGRTVRRYFCGHCGTALFADGDNGSGLWSVKAGSLDDPDRYQPQGHIWTRSARPWHWIDPTLPAWQEEPTADEIVDRP